jgi:hypothetical protein
MKKKAKNILKKTLFIILNFIVLATGYISIQSFFILQWSVPIIIVAFLVMFFVPYSIIVYNKLNRVHVIALSAIIVMITFITFNSSSIKLQADIDACNDFGGAWVKEENRCERFMKKPAKFNYGANLIDINNDRKQDLVVKSRVENGNAHSFDKLEFFIKQNGKLYKVTNKNFATIEGADCILQSYKYINNDYFTLIEYTRNMGNSYNSQEDIYKKEYILEYNEDFIPGENPYAFKQISEEKLLGKYCDVGEVSNEK